MKQKKRIYIVFDKVKLVDELVDYPVYIYIYIYIFKSYIFYKCVYISIIAFDRLILADQFCNTRK